MSKKHKRPIPVFDFPIIETHCHLDYLKEEPLEEILEKCQAHNVESLITIAVEPNNLNKVLQLADSHDHVYCTQGIHPHEAETVTDQVLEQIRENAEHEKVLAIGEIGLDYYYDNADRAVQRKVFAQQLEMAANLELPVVIHTREADADTRAILSEYAPQMKRKGVIHSFTSGIELGEFCLEQGFNLGFNGICTFNKADNVRDMIRIAPMEQILLETDSPFLTPTPYRGRENAPYYIPLVAEKVAEVKELNVRDVLEQAYKNSKETFVIPTRSH